MRGDSKNENESINYQMNLTKSLKIMCCDTCIYIIGEFLSKLRIAKFTIKVLLSTCIFWSNVILNAKSHLIISKSKFFLLTEHRNFNPFSYLLISS